MKKNKFHPKIIALKKYRDKYGNYDKAVKYMIEDGIIENENEVKGLTLEEVGYVLGITRERVRQIEANAYRKIRKEIIKNPKYRSIFTNLL